MRDEAMSIPNSGQRTLDREYLPVRAKILEIAASLDRVERAEGSPADDARWQRLRAALEIVFQQGLNRTEQVQLHFSRPYDELWREEWDI